MGVEDATVYIRRHRITQLFEEMMCKLLKAAPDDPLQFLLRLLRGKIEEQSGKAAREKHLGSEIETKASTTAFPTERRSSRSRSSPPREALVSRKGSSTSAERSSPPNREQNSSEFVENLTPNFAPIEDEATPIGAEPKADADERPAPFATHDVEDASIVTSTPIKDAGLSKAPIISLASSSPVVSLRSVTRSASLDSSAEAELHRREPTPGKRRQRQRRSVDDDERQKAASYETQLKVSGKIDSKIAFVPRSDSPDFVVKTKRVIAKPGFPSLVTLVPKTREAASTGAAKAASTGEVASASRDSPTSGAFASTLDDFTSVTPQSSVAPNGLSSVRQSAPPHESTPPRQFSASRESASFIQSAPRVSASFVSSSASWQERLALAIKVVARAQQGSDLQQDTEVQQASEMQQASELQKKSELQSASGEKQFRQELVQAALNQNNEQMRKNYKESPKTRLRQETSSTPGKKDQRKEKQQVQPRHDSAKQREWRLRRETDDEQKNDEIAGNGVEQRSGEGGRGGVDGVGGGQDSTPLDEPLEVDDSIDDGIEEESDFESVSQVFGARHPVWKEEKSSATF